MPHRFEWQKRLIISAIIIVPVFFWLLSQSFTEKTLSLPILSTLAGQLAGIIGFSLFALNLILSSRLKLLEKLFGPLNKIYTLHHKNGAFAFCLLLVHPLLLSIKYLIHSASAGLLFLLPSLDNLAKLYGSMALSGMIILLGITFYFKFKYHIWKFSHQFMGLVFIFAFFHVWLIPSTVANNTLLRLFLITLGILGILSYFYRFILSHLKFNQTQFYVSQIKNLSNIIFEINLKPKKSEFNFKPGQFAFFSFSQKNISPEPHPFSLTSKPDEKVISLAAKNLGDFTSTLRQLKTDSKVWIEGPFGQFSYQFFPEIKEMLWIAGGIGITPFLSMAKTVENNRYKIDLFYSTKNQVEAVYLKELENIAKKSLNLHVYPYFSDYEGHLTIAAIERMIGKIEDKDIFICGPRPMMQSLKKQLAVRKINPDKIHSEEFKL